MTSTALPTDQDRSRRALISRLILTVPMLGAALLVLDPLEYRLIAAAATGTGMADTALAALSGLAPRWIAFGLPIGWTGFALARRELRAKTLSRALAAARGAPFAAMAAALLRTIPACTPIASTASAETFGGCHWTQKKS